MIKPLEVRRNESAGLTIRWSDNTVQQLTSDQLRKSCPCALCREQRGDTSHGAPLTPKKTLLRVIENTATESLRLERIWGVGNYAIGMEWGDGHKEGIWTFDYLRGVADSEERTTAKVSQ